MRVLLFSLALLLPGLAGAAPPRDAETGRAIHELIDGQITAFQERDAQAAWRFVDPDLQQQFGTADRFMHMVRVGYAPVFTPKRYEYGELIIVDEETLGQWLDVVGRDGERVKALYLLEQQPDETWRTSGCLLFEPGPSQPVG